MDYIKKFHHTIELFFEKCASRVNQRMEGKITAHEVYPADSKLIIKIKNNKPTRNNRYLMVDSVFRNYYQDDNGERYEVGLIPKLGFENEQEILWGTEAERTTYLYEIFKRIIKDIEENNIYNVDLNQILCDYAPYAFYLTYHELLSDINNTYPDFFYGINGVAIENGIGDKRRDAIAFLYSKCECEFESKFMEFTRKTKSFKKIDEVFDINFIIPQFIPMLEKHIPKENSLGYRVRYLIIHDVSKCAELMAQHYYGDVVLFADLKKRLVEVSNNYVLDLMQIQEDYLQTYILKGRIIEP